MTGLYFSGTGNSRHAVETFISHFDPANRAFSIESFDPADLPPGEDTIVLGYPVYFSNIPRILRDFIRDNPVIFAGRKVFIIATMGIFSGDGTGCSARLLRRLGAGVIGGLHLILPDNTGDIKVAKRSFEANRTLVKRADEKIAAAAARLKAGRPTREGLNFLYHLAGLFGQRLWFYGKTTSYKNKPDIDAAKCTVCGLCMKHCPMRNLEKEGGAIVHGKRCTMCYRCVAQCPAQAITILGNKVYEQHLFEKYK